MEDILFLVFIDCFCKENCYYFNFVDRLVGVFIFYIDMICLICFFKRNLVD